jgi:hypothetical protein
MTSRIQVRDVPRTWGRGVSGLACEVTRCVSRIQVRDVPRTWGQTQRQSRRRRPSKDSLVTTK